MSILGQCYYAACRTRAGHSLARSTVALLRRHGAMGEFKMPLDALELDHPSVEGLMRLWSRVHWSSGDGMMPPEQLLAVYRLAATWPANGDVVELGAWVGLTTSYLAAACRRRGAGKVYAVDTFEGTKEGGTEYPSIVRFGGRTLDAFRDQISRAGVEETVETMIGRTTDVVRSYSGGPIRMLLIDADHSFDGVRGDFDAWSPLVTPGRIIVFHDHDMPDVARFINAEIRPDVRFDISPGKVAPNIMVVTKGIHVGRPLRRASRRVKRTAVAAHAAATPEATV